MIIDLSLKNSDLYSGCEIEEVAGRLNLITPMKEAVNIVGRNINNIIRNNQDELRDRVILTGPMAVWAYMVVFHAVVHLFTEVRYNDGRSEAVLSRHGAPL